MDADKDTELRKKNEYNIDDQLHGMPKVVISYRDVKFTSDFWKALFTGLGMQIQFSITYHP